MQPIPKAHHRPLTAPWRTAIPCRLALCASSGLGQRPMRPTRPNLARLTEPAILRHSTPKTSKQTQFQPRRPDVATVQISTQSQFRHSVELGYAVPGRAMRDLRARSRADVATDISNRSAKTCERTESTRKLPDPCCKMLQDVAAQSPTEPNPPHPARVGRSTGAYAHRRADSHPRNQLVVDRFNFRIHRRREFLWLGGRLSLLESGLWRGWVFR